MAGNGRELTITTRPGNTYTKYVHRLERNYYRGQDILVLLILSEYRGKVGRRCVS